ncbi:MAG: hypothetical protein KDM63_21310, partial [Verrucomicrobiae bacterium]|nr:hypothetical protein [Verrucomicrobiae bacterium]
RRKQLGHRNGGVRNSVWGGSSASFEYTQVRLHRGKARKSKIFIKKYKYYNLMDANESHPFDFSDDEGMGLSPLSARLE